MSEIAGHGIQLLLDRGGHVNDSDCVSAAPMTCSVL